MRLLILRLIGCLVRIATPEFDCSPALEILQGYDNQKAANSATMHTPVRSRLGQPHTRACI